MDTNGNHDANARKPGSAFLDALRIRSLQGLRVLSSPFSFYFGGGHHGYVAPGAALLVTYEHGEAKRARLRSHQLFFPLRTRRRKVSDAQIQALARSYGEDPSSLFHVEPAVTSLEPSAKQTSKAQQLKFSIGAAEMKARSIINHLRQQLLVRWWALGEIARNVGARTRNLLIRIPVPYVSNRRG